MPEVDVEPIGDPHGEPPSGATLTTLPAGGGGTGTGSDTFDNTRNRTLIIVHNDSAISVTVTITAQQTARPDDFPSEQWPAGTVANITKVIAAGTVAMFYGIPSAYNDASGDVHVGYSEIEDVLVQAFEVLKV